MDILALLQLGQVAEEGSYLGELDGGYLNQWLRSGYIRDDLTRVSILDVQFAQLMVLRRGPAGLADGSIVVVGTAHGRVGRAVGAAPVAEGGASVGHGGQYEHGIVDLAFTFQPFASLVETAMSIYFLKCSLGSLSCLVHPLL